MLCPNFLNSGTCFDQAQCPHRHPNFFCDTCGLAFNTQAEYSAHFTTRRHQKATKAVSRTSSTAPRICKICSVKLAHPKDIPLHEGGRTHRVRLQDLTTRGVHYTRDEMYPVDEDVVFHCDICDSMEWHGRQQHLQTVRHKTKAAYLSVRAALNEAEKDKYGISVSSGGQEGVDFGIVDTGVRRDLRLTVTSTIPNIKFTLISVKTSSSQSVNSRARGSPFTVTYRGSEIMYANEKEIFLAFRSSDRGRFQDRIELTFYEPVHTKRFAITRRISAIVGDKEDYEAIKPTAPYIPKHKKVREKVGSINEGPKPLAVAGIEWAVKLGLYDIDKTLERYLNMDDWKERMKCIRSVLPREVTCETYPRQFHTLLHIEEHKASMDLQRYDEEAILLDPSPKENFYYLTVPGLAEKRPSVIVGDKILVKIHGSQTTSWFSGYVHKVEQLRVGLRFSKSFNSPRGQRYDVRFCLGRIPLRRMHQALDSPFSPPRLLYPFDAHVIKKRPPTAQEVGALNVIDRKIRGNAMQKLAVTTIRALEPGSPPFVVFGPPGTGKTVTIIEAIRQILLKNPQARILACAPSNSASDIIADRLTVLGASQLFRMNAPSRMQSTLPKTLEPFSRKNDHDTFYVPGKKELMKFRVIVSTCVSASIPYGIGVPRGHFTHIFVDEAGQAAEPECMIPIKTMADNRTNVILSGDPKQLGPIVRSDLALSLKLGVSYLDRLCEMNMYDESQMSGITVVKLVKNFRSHDTILSYPNEMFYKNELESCADPIITSSCLRWDGLSAPGVPIIFHAMQGKDEREASSPSFFNLQEATEVKAYIQALKQERSLGLNDEHIGVITPYNSQARKIRTLLRDPKLGANGVKVGSVEEFQGQERRVIILSTVRSSMEFVISDIRHSLGFVANPRRFNVAVTRAQALLIVIGDPRVLSLDPLWRGFLNYAYNRGAWKGKPPPDWDTTEAVESTSYDVQRRRQAQDDHDGLIARIADAVEGELRAEDLENEANQEDAVVVERPWREAE